MQMNTIGILAYGSLIEEPGKEIEPLICQRVKNVNTPFSVEFARSSQSRSGAPTLIPVAVGGAPVQGVILILGSAVTTKQAKDLLWRRETRNECSDKHYDPPSSPNPNIVIVKPLKHFCKVATVLYTHIGSNIDNLTADHLADLAICSANQKAGALGKDGISYLISVKRQGITTPLMADYEASLLNKTGASTLAEAVDKIRSGRRSTI